METLMMQRFALYGTLCRIGGCLFVQNWWKRNIVKPTSEWRSLYTLYSAIGFCGFLFFEGAFVLRRYLVADIAFLHAKSTNLVLEAAMMLKLFYNFVAMVVGTPKLLAFFNASLDFEKITGLLRYKPRGIRERRLSLFRRSLVLLTLIGASIFGLRYDVFTVANDLQPGWRVPVMVASVVGGGFYFLYDVLPYVVLIPCCEVLVEYVHTQIVEFKSCGGFQTFRSSPDATTQVETIRINMCRIEELKGMLNGIWRWALMTSSGSLVLYVCIVVNAYFDDAGDSSGIWVKITHALLSSLTTAELAFVSQRLKDEVSLIFFFVYSLQNVNV